MIYVVCKENKGKGGTSKHGHLTPVAPVSFLGSPEGCSGGVFYIWVDCFDN